MRPARGRLYSSGCLSEFSPWRRMQCTSVASIYCDIAVDAPADHVLKSSGTGLTIPYALKHMGSGNII